MALKKKGLGFRGRSLAVHALALPISIEECHVLRAPPFPAPSALKIVVQARTFND